MRLMVWTLPIALAGLAGCGTLAQPASSSAARSVTEYRIDQTEVGMVNQAAQRRGVQVVWVRYPVKAVKVAAASD